MCVHVFVCVHCIVCLFFFVEGEGGGGAIFTFSFFVVE